MPQLPIGCLWINQIEMGEYVGITKVPPPARIVGHGVHGTGDVMLTRDKAVCTLVQGIVSQELRAGGQGCGGPPGRPRNRRAIVNCNPDGAFANITSSGESVHVCKHPISLKSKSERDPCGF